MVLKIGFFMMLLFTPMACLSFLIEKKQPKAALRLQAMSGISFLITIIGILVALFQQPDWSNL